MALIPVKSKFSIFQQIRLLLRQFHDGSTQDATLLDEKLQIVSTQSLDSPHGEIECLSQETPDSPVRVTAWYNGLTGAMGALPTAYTEWLIERQYHYSDGSAKAFIDVFGHRLYCLDYLAWQKNHLYALAESRSALPLQREIFALTGLLSGSAPALQVTQAAVLASGVRSMVNLERLLSQRYGVPAEIVPFTGGWSDVDPGDRCQLGNPAHTLATAPMIGSMRREVHSRFDIFLGPMPPETSRRFTAGAQERKELWSCVQNYVGTVLDFSVSLVISSADLALRPLGESAVGFDLCLGHNTRSHLHRVRLPVPGL